MKTPPHSMFPLSTSITPSMNSTALSPRKSPSTASTQRQASSIPPTGIPAHMLSPQRARQPPKKVNMTMPALPRYHPAMYSSPSGSSASSPEAIASDGMPLSPRSLIARRSEAQRQLLLHQRELASFSLATSKTRSGSRSPRPASPKLNAVASPGPVTPLELEQADGYLLAGHGDLDSATKEEILQRLIATESGQLACHDTSKDSTPAISS